MSKGDEAPNIPVDVGPYTKFMMYLLSKENPQILKLIPKRFRLHYVLIVHLAYYFYAIEETFVFILFFK